MDQAVDRIPIDDDRRAAPSGSRVPRGLVRFGNLFLALLRRLLYLVVRTRVTPDEVASLRVDPQRPLCYVLQDRHLSSLLVLEEEARRLGLPSALAPIGPEFPARRARGILGHPQSESAEHAHGGALGRRSRR